MEEFCDNMCLNWVWINEGHLLRVLQPLAEFVEDSQPGPKNHSSKV